MNNFDANPLLTPTDRQSEIVNYRLSSDTADVMPIAQVAKKAGITRQSVYGLMDRHLGRLERAGVPIKGVEKRIRWRRRPS